MMATSYCPEGKTCFWITANCCLGGMVQAKHASVRNSNCLGSRQQQACRRCEPALESLCVNHGTPCHPPPAPQGLWRPMAPPCPSLPTKCCIHFWARDTVRRRRRQLGSASQALMSRPCTCKDAWHPSLQHQRVACLQAIRLADASCPPHACYAAGGDGTTNFKIPTVKPQCAAGSCIRFCIVTSGLFPTQP